MAKQAYLGGIVRELNMERAIVLRPLLTLPMFGMWSNVNLPDLTFPPPQLAK